MVVAFIFAMPLFNGVITVPATSSSRMPLFENSDVSVMEELLGGTGTPGTDPVADTWEAPAKIPVVEKSVAITPEQGLKFEIPRLRMTTKINAEFSKSGILLLEVAGTVMTPLKSGIAKMKATTI